MDAEKFGTFIQTRRRALGMKQTELAEKLHVTDKAISRWERAVGFPDIKLLEPLAEALELSLTELLQCKVMEQPGEADRTEAEKIMETERKLSWQRRIVLWLGYGAIVAASMLLVSVSRNSALTPNVQKAVYAIAFLGGFLGCRALQYIVGRLYLKSRPWGIWHNYYTWIAMGMMLLGAKIAVNSWMYDTPAPIWNGVIWLGGIVLIAGGWIYYALCKEKEE